MALSSTTQVNIPVVDISSANKDAASELLNAASRYGFVFIENTQDDIPTKNIAHMFDLSKKFFDAPLAEKEEVAISSNKAGKNHGWLSRGVEKLDPKVQMRPDVKEYVRGHLDSTG